MPTILIPPTHIVATATEICFKRALSEQDKDWPEDEWVTLSSMWALNIFRVYDELNMPTFMGTIYPIKNDKTDTTVGYNVFYRYSQPELEQKGFDVGAINDMRFGADQ